jgi:hypothetical protein
MACMAAYGMQQVLHGRAWHLPHITALAQRLVPVHEHEHLARWNCSGSSSAFGREGAAPDALHKLLLRAASGSSLFLNRRHRVYLSFSREESAEMFWGTNPLASLSAAEGKFKQTRSRKFETSEVLGGTVAFKCDARERSVGYGSVNQSEVLVGALVRRKFPPIPTDPP